MSGSLFIVTAPSGAGKTTLVQALLASDPAVRLSVSFTTRAARPGEIDGRHYHFVDAARFAAMREANEFVEWAQVHGHCYGTSGVWLDRQMAENHDVVLEIDWQGARQVRARYPGAIGIFILPPAFEDLERRLRDRAQDGEAVIARRIAAAREEISHVAEFDYVIINKELPEAVADIQAIVRASRLRRAAQTARHPEHFAFRQD